MPSTSRRASTWTAGRCRLRTCCRPHRHVRDPQDRVARRSGGRRCRRRDVRRHRARALRAGGRGHRTGGRLDPAPALPAARGHKYTRGVVGVAAGSDQYPGAAHLVVAGAQSATAGMVRFVGSPALGARVVDRAPEVVLVAGPCAGVGRRSRWGRRRRRPADHGAGVRGSDRDRRRRARRSADGARVPGGPDSACRRTRRAARHVPRGDRSRPTGLGRRGRRALGVHGAA